MKNKLHCILLIDDNEADNFFHKVIIKEANCTEVVQTASGGQEALKFLNTSVNGLYPQPELIFLDINMPGMDGWEFLDEFQKLDNSKKQSTIVVMLTTSLNPDDKKRAMEKYNVRYFYKKPLTTDSLLEILKTVYPGRF